MFTSEAAPWYVFFTERGPLGNGTTVWM